MIFFGKPDEILGRDTLARPSKGQIESLLEAEEELRRRVDLFAGR